MTIVVATVRVHPDKAAKYEATCRALLPLVRAAEPGVSFYNVGKCREAADTYRVVEVYRDAAAMKEHMTSRFVTEAMPSLEECIAELTITINDSIE
jgi:quinol monooxygenase YgiN